MIKKPFDALNGKYCNSLDTYSRFVTREVTIGNTAMGGQNPIRIQSMTTTDTMDTIGTVEQSIRMVDAGCEYIRITAPSIKEAKNLALIKNELRARGYHVPLIADIHFTPNAAEEAARIVEKVRINPGNYADKKRFENFEYTDTEYQAELERIYKKFTPLVKVCKEYGTAMRIGTNHGSLSDRIMSHYGDTPRGMVESAMEFMRMCESLNYYNLVVSMKSSNPQVMVQAYRLLVETMVKEGMNYPLHLGVTEAGDGEDGRIKSAVGIGALLEDGLGDTIRVSLTEDPEFEAPVALALAGRYKWRTELVGSGLLSVGGSQLSVDSGQLPVDSSHLSVDSGQLPVDSSHLPVDSSHLPVDSSHLPVDSSHLPVDSSHLPVDSSYLPVDSSHLPVDSSQLSVVGSQFSVVSQGAQEKALAIIHNPYEYQKRHTAELNTFIGGHQVPRVVIDISGKNLKDPAILGDVGYLYSTLLDKYNMAEQSCDFVYLADQMPSFSFPGNLKQLYNYSTWKTLSNKSNCHPFYSLAEFISSKEHDPSLNLVSICNQDFDSELFKELSLDNTLVFVLETTAVCGLQDQRNAFFKLVEMGLDVPVIIKREFSLKEQNKTFLPHETDFQLYAATDLGALLLDGFGDGVWADASDITTKIILSTSFGILQATRSRISKTEYISCPSCGRTLFDLQITTQMIRSRTDHLKGLKIGIMGCIVNGPGEMADADYGYVGTGPGKITLYRGREVVKKNVDSENALDELIGIIRGDGNWIEPESIN